MPYDSMPGLRPTATQQRLLLELADEPSVSWNDVCHLPPNNVYPWMSHTPLWALGPLCGYTVSASCTVDTPPHPLGHQGSGAGHQPWVLELGVHVGLIPALAGRPLLMFTLGYNLQSHLQLALRGQRGPDQRHKGLAPWLGEEPGQDRCKSHFMIFLKKRYRVI